MNSGFINIIKNFGYSFSANVLSVFVSMVFILLVPKVLTIEEYGYWQLYTFYISYVGFFHLGWTDGIYLRYSGNEYSRLDKSALKSQAFLLTVFEIIVAIIICFFALHLERDSSKQFILCTFSVLCVIMSPHYLFDNILQISNRIKDCARVIYIERLIYSCLMIVFLATRCNSFIFMVLADVISKAIGLMFLLYMCADIIKAKLNGFCDTMREAVTNIAVGSKLMFSNVANLLLVGIIRFSIEQHWNVSVFAQVSLTLSMSNLMMVFINAVSMVIFPMLRRTCDDKLKNMYTSMRTLFVIPMLGALLIYYPMRVIISIWLPKYADSLHFMALLFPMCLYEGKMAMLINTYFKALRMEKILLNVNIAAVIMSVILAIGSVYILDNITLGVLSILLVLAARCILAEYLLSKKVGFSFLRNNLLEIILSAVFVIFSWSLGGWIAEGIYLTIYILYLFLKRQEIIKLFIEMRKLIGYL